MSHDILTQSDIHPDDNALPPLPDRFGYLPDAYPAVDEGVDGNEQAALRLLQNEIVISEVSGEPYPRQHSALGEIVKEIPGRDDILDLASIITATVVRRQADGAERVLNSDEMVTGVVEATSLYGLAKVIAPERRHQAEVAAAKVAAVKAEAVAAAARRGGR